MGLSINKVKYIRSLHQKKFRQKYNNFIVEGDKIAKELLLSNEWEVELVLAEESWLSLNDRLLAPIADRFQKVSSEELKRISALQNPNKVLIVARQRDFTPTSAHLDETFILYLDGIQDPGNVGTILRIADWFGIPYVFSSMNGAELYNSKVLQSSMGAFLRVGYKRENLSALIQRYHTNVSVWGAVLNGTSIYELPPLKKGIIIIGNEGRGISPENKTLLTQEISIPKPKGGGAESLNAAVATGIICSEISVASRLRS